jgi:nicotinate-nucleotide adenylyltransferase
MSKTGLLGGTFDPPHDGHVALARAVRGALDLDEVLLVPAFRNPWKGHEALAGAKDRLRMCMLAVADEPGLGVCDVEVTRRGYSYSVDTVEELQIARPGEYWLIVGADVLAGLPQWKDAHKLLRLARVAAVARDGQAVGAIIAGWDPDMRNRVDEVPMPSNPLTSSKIRDALLRGADYVAGLNPTVRDYIRERGIYQFGARDGRPAQGADDP